MARTPGESRIPVFCSTSKPLTSRLSRPLANLSSKVRAHLSSSDSSTKHRSPSSSMLFGILAGQNSRSKSSKSSSRGSPTPSQSSGQSYNERPLRPSRFFQSLNGNDLSNLKDLKEKKLEASISSAHIGQKVCVAGQKIGVLRYYGKIESDGGWWCGVELDEPYGVNDGSVRGVRYFNCPPQHGLLTPESKVSLVVKDEVKEYISDVSDSGPHSLLGLTQEINSTGDKKHAETTYVVENGWCSEEVVSSSDQNCSGTANVQSASQLSTPTPGSTCSGGIPIWEWTIGSQHSSSAGSLVPSVRGLTLQDPSQASLQLSKHSSFELDESLGILTPDQMADFTMNSAIEGSLHRTPSSEDAPSFLLLDFEDDKMLDLLTNPNSKRSSLEMQYEETPTQVPPSQQAQMIHNSNSDQSCDVNTEKDATIICRDNYNNDVTMKDSDDTIRDQLMEQDAVCKDLSEDTEMSESHASKKTSDIAMSYEISTETPSNSERAELIRINRTPSLEDLPLDKVDVVELCATAAGPSRSVLPAPTSFVTSVTSITSLDNGYQGDGEWSRPASRGADHSPSAHQAVKVKPMDPMTDSDFFTESDADMHDDLSTQAGSGTCRGDRRAQVIDGTLYGGVSGGTMQNNNSAVYLQHHQSNQRCPSFTPTNTEEMDSSGIYSDLERRNEEPVSDGGKSTMDDNVVNEQQNEKDLSPDGSTRTASSKSENSQTRMTPADFTALIMEQMNTIKNLAIPRPMEDQAISCNIMTIDEDGYHSVVHMNGETLHNEVLTEKSVNEAKDSVNNNNNNNNCTKKTNATKDEHVIKKYKMPKRNVVSKIKTMISSSAANNNNNNNNKKDGGEDENQENRRPGEKPGKAAKKGGRWDAVMNKIAQGKAEEKTKPSRLKEVKSKVFAGISLEPAAAQMPRNGNLQSANSRKLTSARNLTATQSVSTRSLRDVTSLKMKSRRSRTRGSECSLQVSGKSAASQTSSRNSSLSDVSLNVSPALSKVSPQSVRSNKKREPGRSTSPQSDGSNNSASRHPTAVSTLPHARPLPQKNGNKVVTEKKTSPNRRKQPPRQAAYEPPVERDLNRVTGSGHRVGASKTDSPQCRPHELPVLPPPPPTALKPSPPPLPDYALPRLQHATAGFHALTVLVNHLVFNLDAFSTPSLKKELERMRADWLKTKLDLDEVRISYTRSEEEKKAYEQRLQDAQYELQAHNKHRQELSSILRDQEVVVQELQQRISIQAEELTCREQEITNLKESHSQEVAALKKTAQEEVAAKEAEMQERLDVVTKKYEEVKAQSQTLLETLHADKDSKLQVTLGRCKMLEDEVKSLNAVLELRIGELQDLRRQYEIAQHDAQQLPAALQKNSVLQLKIEDLEAQLERKSTAEQILSQENRLLAESIQQEAKQKKRLSQHNEELQWKLKQNSEVVSALAALSGVSDISAHKRGPVHIHLAPKTPIQCHTDLQVNAVRSQQLPSTSNHKETSPPQSPKVYAVVEKSDSVSWVLEMDESPEDVASRLVRRAHSFRAVHSATPSPAHHSRTLPNPHKRQRSRTSSSVSVISSKPPRMRSFSLDSDNSDVPRKTVANWDDSVSHPTRLKPIVNSNNHINDNEDSIVVETVGDDPLHGFLDLDVQIDAEKLEVMGGEDFASPKMSSSSGDSEASVRSRRNETKTLDPEEIMVINSDHGWISLPKESGGEAMISEETTDTDSTSSDSDEDHSCSEDESLSGSASELIERRNKLYLERKIKMELKQQGVVDCSSKNSELKPAITTVLLSDSGSVSAATTAMDLSWSEDVELTSSETEV